MNLICQQKSTKHILFFLSISISNLVHAVEINDISNLNVPTPHANCYWVQPGRLLAGEYPGTYNDAYQKKLDLYLDAGITSFIDLTEAHELRPYEDILRKKAQERGIKVNYRRISIKDMDVPSVQTMHKIINAIRAEQVAGHNVYVHCWGGIGRTGTVIGCYLVDQGMTGEQALMRLSSLWKGVEKSKFYPVSPQTIAQRNFVLYYAQVIDKKGLAHEQL